MIIIKDRLYNANEVVSIIPQDAFSNFYISVKMKDKSIDNIYFDDKEERDKELQYLYSSFSN